MDAAEPEPGPGDVVVDVHAVGVSFPDLLLSQGRYQVRPEPPFTLGIDLAGETVLVHGAAGGVGFASGQGIPEVRVNRLLLNNVDVRGVGWGAFAMTTPTYMREQWDLLLPMIESGVVSPPIGATYDLADFPRALQDVADRRTLGKNVVRLR